MPSMAQLSPAALALKILCIGDPGSGKSGSLASLANAGYEVRVIDFDNGLDCVGAFLTPEGAKRFIYETFTDNLVALETGVTWIGQPRAYINAVKLLAQWKMPERKIKGIGDEEIVIPAYDLGPVTSWGPNVVLVIDSATLLGNAVMRYNLSLQKSMNEDRKLHPYPQDWGEAQQRQESIVEFLYSTQVKCNVIVTAHIKRQGGGGMQGTIDAKTGNTILREVDSSEGKGYPSFLGRALPPKMGRYFNTILDYYTDEFGNRKISTVPRDNIDCKNPAPKHLKKEYGLDGLAEIFETIKKVHAVPGAGK